MVEVGGVETGGFVLDGDGTTKLVTVPAGEVWKFTLVVAARDATVEVIPADGSTANGFGSDTTTPITPTPDKSGGDDEEFGSLTLDGDVVDGLEFQNSGAVLGEEAHYYTAVRVE